MIKKTEWIFFARPANRSYTGPSLARELAEHSVAVIVHQPISVIRNGGGYPSLSGRVSKVKSSGYCIEYRPIHFPERAPWIGKFLKRYNARKMAIEVDKLLAPFSSSRRIVCYDSPTQYPLVGTLGEDLSVYLAIDDRTVTVWGEPIAGEMEAERKLLQRVDQVVCVSAPLASTLRARAGGRDDPKIDVLTNGYDDQIFDPLRVWEAPAELAAVPRPRILVSGHVSERIDWDGVREAAALRPSWSWVFVGPADVGTAQRAASICESTGSHAFLFAPVPHEEVPAWIAHCEVCAVPYRLNNFTLASSPLKAIEYLAAGAPVLSTEIPALEPFGDVISWVKAGDGKSYAAALDSLGQQERFGASAARRQAAVQAETWAHKAKQFSDLFRTSL